MRIAQLDAIRAALPRGWLLLAPDFEKPSSGLWRGYDRGGANEMPVRIAQFALPPPPPLRNWVLDEMKSVNDSPWRAVAFVLTKQQLALRNKRNQNGGEPA